MGTKDMDRTELRDSISRRSAIAASIGLLGGIANGTAWAQAAYPSKPVRVSVPFTPGGAADIVARQVGQKLGEAWSQAVVIENRPGAGGAIAADYVVKSPPDGYSLLVADFGQLCINPALNPKLSYQPLRDLQPISPVAAVPLFYAVNPSLPITSVQTFIDYVKAHPGFAYGTVGVGTSHHLSMELLRVRTGINLNHIPYKGGAQSIPAAIAGDVGLVISALGALLPHVKSGKLRLIGVTTLARSPLAPEVAPISDVVPGYNVSDMVGFLAPAQTPGAIAQSLNQAIVSIVQTPDFVKRLGELGLEARVSSPAQYTELIRTTSQVFGKLIKDLGITAE
jgi:tripartite-type tricarboxylate transporter receptor subunit TctC